MAAATLTPSTGNRQVVVAATADRVHGAESTGHQPLVPAGVAHAVVLGAEQTLCGLPTRLLSMFPGLAFGDVDFLRRCPECLRVLARTAAG